MLAEQWQALRTALQLLTTIPMGTQFYASAKAGTGALLWYPVVGFLIGALMVLVVAVFHFLPPLLLAVLTLTFWVALSGALHLDGLADCGDAWMAGVGDRERTLDVMKDPRCGPVAVVVLVLVLLLKVAALSTLLAGSLANTAWLLLAVPMLARAMILPVFLWVPYVRTQGLGKALAEGVCSGALRTRTQQVLVFSLLVPLLFLPLPLAGVLVGVCIVTYALWRREVLARLQGFTGDCIGALVELTEVFILIAAVIFWAGK